MSVSGARRAKAALSSAEPHLDSTNRVVLAVGRLLPGYPDEQTFAVFDGMSQKGPAWATRGSRQQDRTIGAFAGNFDAQARESASILPSFGGGLVAISGGSRG